MGASLSVKRQRGGAGWAAGPRHPPLASAGGLLALLLWAALQGAPALAQSAAAWPLAGDGATPAAAAASGPAAAAPDAPALVELHHRQIVTLRARLLGDTPAERAELARQAIEAVAAQAGPGRVTHDAAGDAVRFQVDGQTVFFLLPEDVGGARPGVLLEAATRQVAHRLQAAVAEAREMRDPRQLALGAASAAAATVLAVGLAWGLFRIRRRLVQRLDAALQRWHQRHPAASLVGAYGRHAHGGVRWLAAALAWVGALLVAELWATFVLRQFAYTRPWGERASLWLLDRLQAFALAIAAAVPGLLTAVLIFTLAWLLTRTLTLLLRRVEQGELQLAWLDRDTAGPTRRLGHLLVWLFALAIAYPYLPGAQSESFKGVTVLAGLMLSLGASGAVGQAMSGLSLMYARAMRPGEYVKIGEVEGTVSHMGLFATQIHTGMGEAVSLPNAVIAGQAVRNFSRLVGDGQFVLHTAVTIGYATPWRQVHHMLLEAARRTPGVATEPPPYVVQTALSDFYVEYRLCAQADRSAPRRRAEAMNQLHGHIQDVFNEHGVQIMSPHYMTDTAQPQVVKPGAWFPVEGREGGRT
ncbi:mechanosensitive ion channel family protein [Aquincola tertiaricarbonis]|uniref:Small-conductance mechanosensitive channel n=1 Tax=Aquincola tertiaricarbonis TaxID=391953 RepID=A0ABY4S2F2_AQUTE|nr:mechanosensitive ion channel domain-containing protein [Aquincola tertiaricarbonis]URI07138.1 mechanosensitive ion channel family protein [Aquincola tertiaricarbonis]